MRTLKRLILWFQIRALEATIYGREEMYPMVQDKMVLANMEHANNIARAELRRLKKAYHGC